MTNHQVSVFREFGRGSLSSADRPDRLVGDAELRSLLCGDTAERPGALAAENIFGQIRFALFDDFANATDRRQTGFHRNFKAAVNRVVSLTKVLATFRMSDDDVFTPSTEEHRSGNLSCKRAFLFPIHILCANFDLGAACGFDDRSDIDVRRANDDLVASVAL